MVTGGAGFIGSNFIRYALGQFNGRIINVDSLTYAGNEESLVDVATECRTRYVFERADITDRASIESVFARYDIDAVVHFAAESHVDRSIHGPEAFLRTNVMGTFTLLEVARQTWKDRNDVRFHHVSTDEVYGSLGETGESLENDRYHPSSPYSASKAASDHLVMAWHHTYGLPVTLSHCSNNYGPFQFPEKFIPVMILNLLQAKPLPIYGNGQHVRDWLYVDDHNSAVWTILNKGRVGDGYNIGGENPWQNLEVVDTLIEIVARLANRDPGALRRLVTHVADRPGHDRRYALNCDKLKSELGWRTSVTFDQGLERTVRWYIDNTNWIDHVRGIRP